MRITMTGLLTLVLAGCSNPVETLEKQTKSTGSIITRKTQNIEKFDPNTPNQTVVGKEVKVSNDPVSAVTGTYALEAYGGATAQISDIAVTQAINLWKVQNDNRTPTYDEFMEQIIKANNIQLPVQPGDRRYAYDESTGQLVIVERPGIGPEGGVGPDNRIPQPAAPASPAQ